MNDRAEKAEAQDLLGPLTRRSFLKLGALLSGAGAAAASGLFSPFTPGAEASSAPLPGDPPDDAPDVRVLYTTCQMCHSRCGLKCKIWNGTLVKVDGNPYNPTNTEFQDGTHAETIPYATDPTLDSTKRKRGRICGKAQTAIEMLYNPTRLRTPLKRVGPRGGGKWEAISWSQAVSEIVHGGTIDNGDGTTYSFSGLKALRDINSWIGGTAYLSDKKTGTASGGTPTTLTDASGGLSENAFAGMDLVLTGGTGAGETRRIVSNSTDTYTVAPAWTTVPDHTTTYAVRAGDLGRAANMVLYSPGRQPAGNSAFTDRVWKDAFGTANFRLDHTSICETSHHVATNLMTSDKRAMDGGTQSGKNGFAPDLKNARYVIFFGENPAEAAFPHQSFARKLVDAMHRSTNPLKVAVVDPRLSNTAAIVRQNGGTWVSPKPGTDAAIALGMIAWILENVIEDANATSEFVQYLTRLNRKAAIDAGETTFTDACYLVVRTSADAGIHEKELLDASKLASGAGSAKDYVAVVSGTPTAVDPDSTTQSLAAGTLEVDGLVVTTTGGSVVCDSVYTLLKKQALAGKTSASAAIAHWAEIAGVPAATIVQLAQDFTSFGRKAVASHYRGSVQHTNGTYTSMAINTLNWLIGNTDRKGGASAGGSYSEGSPPFNGAKAVPLGPRIDRAGKNHTDVPTFFAAGPDGGRTPTKRAWFPFAQNGNFQEMVPSIGAQYPYACKALITQWNVWPYSVPGGKDVARAVVLDTAKVPLHVAIDVQLGELSALADYVLPEVTFLETFATPHIAPTILQKEGTTRIPVVGRYLTTGGYKDVSEVTDFSTIVAGSEATAVWGPTPYFVPILPETRTHADILLHLMIGPEGISPANDAADSTTDPTKLGGLGANAFGPNDHLYTAWDFFKKLFTNYATANPPLALSTPGSDQVSNMLLRGGRFDDGDGTSGDLLANKFGSTSAPKIIHLYVEDLAKKVNSQTGEKDWTPLAAYEAVKDARGNAVVDAEFPFQLVTFKVSWHGQGRTVVNPTLMSIAPENSIWINAADAAAMRIVLGDRVRLTSPSNATGVVGRAFVTQGIAPGVVAVSHHFGHWELFSRPHVVSGVVTEFDRRRAGGITINPILRLDPVFGDVALQDYIGGSVSFYDTRVKVEKA